jgi:hypothetical protein
MTMEVPPEERLHDEDGCPLFSPQLEQHLVAVSRGEAPNAGRFCGHCYTPLSRDTRICPHCANDQQTGRAAVEHVPEPITEMLRVHRKTESRWVNGFAYLGLLIATIAGLVFVLATPVIQDSLIWATVVYGIILLVGGRMLAGFLGGYYGDRLGYAKARARTRASWEAWVGERDNER